MFMVVIMFSFVYISRSFSPCSGILHECQMKQIPRYLQFPLGELEETTRTPSYYVNEDYPARPEIQ